MQKVTGALWALYPPDEMTEEELLVAEQQAENALIDEQARKVLPNAPRADLDHTDMLISFGINLM